MVRMGIVAMDNIRATALLTVSCRVPEKSRCVIDISFGQTISANNRGAAFPRSQSAAGLLSPIRLRSSRFLDTADLFTLA